MDYLKSSRLVAPHSRGVSLIARLALSRRVLENDLGSFEYLDR